MKYDDAETYFLNFTTGLPNEAGGIPIGLYLLWAADAGLVVADVKREIDSRRARGQSAAELLFDLTDGALLDGMFTEEGAAFTAEYYGRGYFADYQRCFRLPDGDVDTLCSVPDNPESVRKLKPYANERLILWRATPQQPPVKCMGTPEAFEWLREHLLPELRADGFQDLNPRNREFEVRRRRGTIEQILLFMVMDRDGEARVTFHFFLGAERLRSAGTALLDAPPPTMAEAARRAPDVGGDELSLTPRMSGFGPYYDRIPAGREQQVQICLRHYLEQVRPAMAALDSITALATLIHNEGQRLRLRNVRPMQAPLLAARVLLLSAYGDHLRGPDAEELLFQIRQQARTAHSADPEALLTLPQIDRLIERVHQPGVLARLREAFDSP